MRSRPPVPGGDRERPRPGGEGGDLLPDPGSPMSPAAVLVMALVALVLAGACLIAVFRAARQPASGPAYPGRQGAGPAPGRQAGPRGADAASARQADTPPGQADQAAAQAGKAGSPPASTGARERATGHPARPHRNAGGQYAPPIERRRSPGCFRGHQRPWLPALWRRRRRSPYTRTRRKTLQPARSAAGPMTSGRSLGALHPAPARNAGQPASELPFLALSLIANIINC